jgi:hypothetical protein
MIPQLFTDVLILLAWYFSLGIFFSVFLLRCRKKRGD